MGSWTRLNGRASARPRFAPLLAIMALQGPIRVGQPGKTAQRIRKRQKLSFCYHLCAKYTNINVFPFPVDQVMITVRTD